MIGSCKIEGVDGGNGIDIATGRYTYANEPGKAENVSERSWSLITTSMLEERLSTITVGVLIFSGGVPGAEVEAYGCGKYGTLLSPQSTYAGPLGECTWSAA